MVRSHCPAVRRTPEVGVAPCPFPPWKPPLPLGRSCGAALSGRYLGTDHPENWKDQQKMMTPADVKVLERLVGSGTFARGSSYARAGAVRTRKWSPGGTH